MARSRPRDPDRVDRRRRSARATRPAAPDADKPKPLGSRIRAALADLHAEVRRDARLRRGRRREGRRLRRDRRAAGRRSAPGASSTRCSTSRRSSALALGAGQVGLLPVPEIQFLAYLHNAEDQLRGEASTLSFFSRGQLKNPMVVRIAGLGYQKGFGGHFHNDNSLAVLRDLPGVIVAVPSRGDDAVKMLRTLVAAAHVDGRVCVFVEPIALYHARDLFPGRRRVELSAARRRARRSTSARSASTRRARRGASTGRPRHLHLRQRRADVRSARARPLGEREASQARVVDLRWIAPLPAARDRSSMPARRARSSSSTSAAARATCPRRSPPSSPTRPRCATSRSRASRRPTRSSRSRTPRTSCSCRTEIYAAAVELTS